jgi:hypothetical protein
MKDKEQVLDFFLSGKIRLSQYDYKFMANLLTMMQANNRVTSNQAKLFDTLIFKYKKQLVKNGVKDDLSQLSWSTEVLDSTPDFTGARVSLIEDQIVVKVPFNKSFINNLAHVNSSNGFFNWDKAEKVYRGAFTTASLKLMHKNLPKYFVTVSYCEVLRPILDDLQKYQGLVWNPTARKHNGRLLIGACNDVLWELIGDDILAITPNNLHALARLGVRIDPNVYENDQQLRFAASECYEADLSVYETVVSWMKNLGCTDVVMGGGVSSANWRVDLEGSLRKHNINFHGGLHALWRHGHQFPGHEFALRNVMRIQQASSDTELTRDVTKVIVIKDSRPVDINKRPDDK